MTTFRQESDSMGVLDVPENALYKAQTQRAVNNFTVSKLTMPPEFIRALAYIKQAAAEANAELGHLPQDKAQAIAKAALRSISGRCVSNRIWHKLKYECQ
jgi:fumarate hydratase class II